MGLPWIRLDTSMPDNPKILGLAADRVGKAAAFVWVCCMAYSGKHETAGFIPREAMTRVNGTSADFKKLVAADLMTECAGGWDINGWDEFQLSTDEAQARREKARKAAAARWSKAEARKAEQS